MHDSSAPLVTTDAPQARTWTPRESRLHAGVAVTDVTPPVGIRAHSWGAARTGQATGVHRPLTASALSIRDDDGAWRDLVTVDLGWWQSLALFSSVFDPVAAAVGATRRTLLLHLVHTHAGPSLAEADPALPGGDLVEPYRVALVDALVDVIRRARAAAGDRVVTWATGRCGMAVVRDLPCDERDVLAFAPGAVADDTVLVGRITDASGVVRGTVVNYACHPTTLAHENSLLSPDFIGATRELVEERTGAPCLFLQGASGDLAPREQYLPGTELADRHGRSLGHAVLSTLETMGAPATRLDFAGVVESGAPLGIWSPEPADPSATVTFRDTEVELECVPRPTPEQLTGRWAGIDPLAAQERVARAERLAAGYDRGGRARHPLWVWQLGDAVLVAQPGEAYSWLQTELRARHPERAVLVLNLTNGPGTMYLPPREAYERNRYQVWQTLLAAGSLERVVDAADALVSALPAARPEVTR